MSEDVFKRNGWCLSETTGSFTWQVSNGANSRAIGRSFYRVMHRPPEGEVGVRNIKLVGGDWNMFYFSI